MTQKTSVRIAVLGQLPDDFDLGAVLKWRSSVFQVAESAETYHLADDAKGNDWEYTDNQLEKYLDHEFPEDFQLILVNVRLQHNWYLRRLTRNRLIFTFHEMAEILRFSNIPLKNLVLRVLYAATLVHRRYGGRIPPGTEETNYTHDETRGCLFDMNAAKWDVVHSCHQPILCEACAADLKKDQVSNEQISGVRNDLKRIKKPLFNRLAEFVRQHPVRSFFVSLAIALIVGTISSLLGTILYQTLFDAT
jgi:hypothetical protein